MGNVAQNGNGHHAGMRPRSSSGNAATSGRDDARRLPRILAAVLVLVVAVSVIWITDTRPWASRTAASPDSYAALQQVKSVPRNATSRGGLLLRPVHQADARIPTVEIYVDPMCPACGEVDRTLNATLTTLWNAGQIAMELHPVSFLDGASTDEYSTRAASALAYVGERDPQHALEFMGKLFAQDHQPSESDYRPIANRQIMRWAVEAGVPTAVAASAVNGRYMERVKKSTSYTIARKDLQSPDRGGFATPLIRVNRSIWSIQGMQLAQLPSAFVHCLGLTQAQVGMGSRAPSIGSAGKPLE